MKINYSTWYSMNASIRKLFIIAAICLAGFTTANATGIIDSSDKEITLTTMGVDNGEMSFTLKYDNENADRLYIVLKDKQGNLLYQKIFKDKKLNRTFKIESDIKSVTLTVTNLNSKAEQKFEILNHTRVIEKVIVATTY